MREVEKFSDVLDIASFLEAEEVSNAIKYAQSKLLEKSIEPIGKCYNCGEHVDASKLFCDKDCTDDYETRMRSNKQNAKVF